MMSSNANICLIIPAYNEGPVIAQVLSEVTRLPYQIIVVDDGSTDDTACQALQFPVTLLRHCINLGQGAAIQTGVLYALRFTHAQYLITFDADGQHNLSSIERLLEPLSTGAYDIVLGSRFLPGAQAQNIHLLRKLILQLALVFTRLTTGLELTDTHNGLRAFTRQTAARLQITQNRMAHASEILHQIRTLHLRYCEMPVSVTYTKYSLSKGQSIWESINILWEMIMGEIR